MCALSINPYVGPRPFKEEEWELFFGREQEAEDLLSIVLADRLVLFFAPSGAGKSSLLNTNLRRGLREAGFAVLPTARVSGDASAQAKNIFVYNLIFDLDKGQHDKTMLAPLSLADYLHHFQPPPLGEDGKQTKRQVLIIDQFEEIFTTHPEAWEQREAFFEQLRQALDSNSDENARLWVVLAMREENVAALERYKHLLPGKLRTRFYMQKLNHDAAMRAIMEPAAKGERPFESSLVAEELVKNLSLIWARDHERKEYPGEFVEPVQLQVVCHQLWSELAVYPDAEIRLADKIRMQDLTCIAGSADLAQFVDTSLARFYEDAVHAVANTGVAEAVLRDWFEEQLITGAGTRNLVYCDVDNNNTGGLPNQAVQALAGRLLIHEESRAAGSFYELIHDRLIEPILNANRQWYENNPGILLARAWKDAGRSPTKLLEGRLLQEAIEKHWQALTPLVAEFVDASRVAQTAKLRVRWMWLGIATLIITFAMFVFWLNLQNQAEMAKTTAVGLLVNETQLQMKEKPQLSLLLAAQAVALSPEAYVLKNLSETLTMITSAPVSSQDQRVITDGVVVAASPDGKRLAVGGADGRVHIQSLITDDLGLAQATLSAHTGAVTAIAFSSDGRWLSTGGADAVVNLFDLQASSWAPIPIRLGPELGAVVGLAFKPTTAPAPPSLVVSSKVGVVHSIDWSTPNKPVVTAFLMQESKNTIALAFSPDGQWLATVNNNTKLYVWPLFDQSSPIHTVRLLNTSQKGSIVFTFSPDGRWLAAGNTGDPSVYLFDLAQPSALPFLFSGHEQGVRAIAFSPDSGSRSVTKPSSFLLPVGTLAVGSGDGIVRLWVLDTLTRTAETRSAIVIPTRPGSTELAPQLSDRTVELSFIPVNITPMWLPQRTGEILALTFGQEVGETGKMWLAIAGADHAVELWDMDNLSKPQYIVYGHDEAVTSVFWGAQAALVFTQSQDGTIRVWSRELAVVPQNLAQFEQELPKWLNEACRRAGRDFYPDERKLYLGNLQVESSCGADSPLLSH